MRPKLQVFFQMGASDSFTDVRARKARGSSYLVTAIVRLATKARQQRCGYNFALLQSFEARLESSLAALGSSRCLGHERWPLEPRLRSGHGAVEEERKRDLQWAALAAMLFIVSRQADQSRSFRAV